MKDSVFKKLEGDGGDEASHGKTQQLSESHLRRVPPSRKTSDMYSWEDKTREQ